ncbi:MAG: ABC transporter permease [Spirochaetales bacterium]|nr:ABC transporter permease [Spirochaetales bacterium]
MSNLKKQLKGKENFGVVAMMVVFIAIVVALSGSSFFTTKNIANLLRSVSVMGIMSCAVTLIMVTGNIDLSLGWMIGFCAVITGQHSGNFGEAIFWAILAGIGCGAFNGFLVGILKLNAFIATLGTMYAFKGITTLYSDGRFVTKLAPSEVLKFVGQGEIGGIPTPIIIFALFAIIFWFLLKKTEFGTKVYAVGANQRSAHFSGIRAWLIVLVVYTLAGLATGVAGTVLYAKVMSVQPYSGVGLEFDVLTAVVLGGTSVTGGKGNVLGTILGVIFVGILSNGFTLIGLGSNATYITQGIVLLIAMWADVKSSGGVRS